MQKPAFKPEGHSALYHLNKMKRHVQGCALLWEVRTCKRGGVCNRHWRALFKKQLLPVLMSPEPMVTPLGQVVSIEPVKSAAIFLLDGDGTVGVIEPWATVWAAVGTWQGSEPKKNCEHKKVTSGLALAFGEPFTGSYFPSAPNSVPDDDPSTNSTTGGKSLLKVSMSLAGRNGGTLSDG